MLVAMMRLGSVATEYGLNPTVLMMLAQRHGYWPGDLFVELLPDGGSVRVPIYSVDAVVAIVGHGVRSGDLSPHVLTALTNAIHPANVTANPSSRVAAEGSTTLPKRLVETDEKRTGNGA